MSTRHIPYPSDFEIDHVAAHQEERRRRALQSLDVGDVLGVADHRGDLVTARDEKGGEKQSDTAVPSEDDDAGHAFFPHSDSCELSITKACGWLGR